MAARKVIHCAGFRVGEYAVYPSHGLGIVSDIEQYAIDGKKGELIVINFEKLGLKVRLPPEKIPSTGLRKISSLEVMGEALDVLVQPPDAQQPVWPRALKIYEAKLNTGDPIQIAELVRDLHCPPPGKGEHSQRAFYERVLDRLADELSAVEGIGFQSAADKISSLVG